MPLDPIARKLAENAVSYAEQALAISQNAVGSATAQANASAAAAQTASTKADTATTAASGASASMITAMQQAEIAVSAATTASTGGQTATAQAAIATTGGQTATAQAVIATTGAATSTAQAIIATTGAQTATAQAGTVAAMLASFRSVFLGVFASDADASANAAANSVTLAAGLMYDNSTEGKFRIYGPGGWGDYDSTAQASQSAAQLSAAAAAQSSNAAQAAAASAATAQNGAQAIAALLPFPYYSTRAVALAATGLAVGQSFLSDETGALWVYKKSSTTAYSAVAAITTPAYVDRLKSLAQIPTVDLGAVGDGAHAVADQAGFAAAMAAIIASRNGVPTGTLDLFQYQNGMVIEPGIYDAGGFTMTDGKSWLKARIPGTVFIRIPAGQYFLTVTGQLMSLYWDGIVFLGGKGAFKATSTSNNANQQIRFTNCYFGNYTECAISNNFGDSPFLKVDNCQFGGLGANIGIAWGGYVDQLSIENCAIGGNDYGIAVGPHLSGNYNIAKNDLLQNRKADVWIKPNITDTGTTNAGWAGAIVHNKFGNETQTVGNPYPRILIANEDTTSGADRATYKPLATAAGDTGHLVLPTIAHNRFAHISGWTAPVIRSYVSAVSYGFWQNNKFDGGQNTYVIEWPNGRSSDYSNTNSHFEVRESDGSVPVLFATHPFGRLFDYGSFWPGDANAVPVYPVADNPGLALITAGYSGYELTYPTGTTAIAAPDPYGTTEYASVTGMAYLGFADPYAGAGGPVFVEVMLSRAATNSLSQVTIDLFNYSGASYALKRTVALPPNGSPAKVTIPVLLPSSASPGAWQARVYGANVVSGVSDTFVIGGLIVSQGAGRLGMDRALKRYLPALRNAPLSGGAQSVLPTGWSISANVNGQSGISVVVNRVGWDKYGFFVELAFSGTCTAAGAVNVYFEVARAIGLESGNAWRFFMGARLMSGDFSGAKISTGSDGSTGSCVLALPCYAATGGSPIQNGSVCFTPTTTYKVAGRTFTASFLNSGADYAMPMLGVGFAVGATTNAVVRVYSPTLQRTQ